ncbi:uncharacterized protein P884DRAFT_272640 [Thermothelomyces heterothallicus CBS 202.75]|uniref:uncharacterized protein n=1 Tax=Thermothelomyces heterothallicus CBS 202.75 TaxID=1149848 RepID=UPI0037443A75
MSDLPVAKPPKRQQTEEEKLTQSRPRGKQRRRARTRRVSSNRRSRAITVQTGAKSLRRCLKCIKRLALDYNARPYMNDGTIPDAITFIKATDKVLNLTKDEDISYNIAGTLYNLWASAARALTAALRLAGPLPRGKSQEMAQQRTAVKRAARTLVLRGRGQPVTIQGSQGTSQDLPRQGQGEGVITLLQELVRLAQRNNELLEELLIRQKKRA